MNLNQTAINTMYSDMLCGNPTTGWVNPPQGTQTRYLHLYRDDTGYMDNFIASTTVNPLSTIAMSGKEISNYDYAKLDVSGKFGPFSGGYIGNTTLISFPAALSDWGKITHIGMSATKYDGTPISYPNAILWIARLLNDEYVYTGDTLFFKTGAVRLNFN